MPRLLDPAECRQVVTSARWLERIEVALDGCLLMGGASTGTGYPQVSVGGVTVKASRVALVAALGRDIRPGMVASHKCHDEAVRQGLCVGGLCTHRRCVNPDHLAEESQRVNLLSGDSANARNVAKSHCDRGHLLPDPDSTGERNCPECSRIRARSTDALIREAHTARGLTQRQYKAKYGSGRDAAFAVLALIEEVNRD